MGDEPARCERCEQSDRLREQYERRRQFVRVFLAIGWSVAFAGGALFGMLAVSLGLPPSWWAPAILTVSAGLWLLTRAGRAGGPAPAQTEGEPTSRSTPPQGPGA